MLILNLGHPLSAEQLEAAERLAGQGVGRVIDLEIQLDPAHALASQIRASLDGAGLSPVEWQTGSLLVNLPGYAVAAACVLAQIEGRRGHLPTIMQLSRRAGSVLTEYELTALINLEEERATARQTRYEK